MHTYEQDENEEEGDEGCVRQTSTAVTHERNRVRHKFPVTVITLDGRRLDTIYDKETTIREVLQEIGQFLRIRRLEYFGLCTELGRVHRFFADQDLVKQCVDLHQASISRIDRQSICITPILLMRIRLLMPINCLDMPDLRDHYFRQLLANMDQYRMQIDEQTLIKAAGWILQRQFGDFADSAWMRCETGYYDSLPKVILRQNSSWTLMSQYIRQMHQFCTGSCKNSAEFQVIKQLSTVPFDLNVHLLPLSIHDSENGVGHRASVLFTGANSPDALTFSRAKSLPKRLSAELKRSLSSFKQTNSTRQEAPKPQKSYWLGIKPHCLQIYEEAKNGGLVATASSITWDEIDNIRSVGQNTLRLEMRDAHRLPLVEFQLASKAYPLPPARDVIELIRDIHSNYLSCQMNASHSLFTFERSDYQPFRERYISGYEQTDIDVGSKVTPILSKTADMQPGSNNHERNSPSDKQPTILLPSREAGSSSHTNTACSSSSSSISSNDSKSSPSGKPVSVKVIL